MLDELRQDRDFPPEELTPEPIAAALKDWREKRQEWLDAQGEQFEVESDKARMEAEEADARALAEALDAGKRDPGPKHVQARAEKLAHLRRHTDARKIRADEAWIAFLTACEQHGSEWKDLGEVRMAAARERLAEFLPDLHAVLGDLVIASALRGFVATSRWNPMSYDAKLRDLPSAPGLELPVSEVLAALEALTVEPEPQKTPAEIQAERELQHQQRLEAQAATVSFLDVRGQPDAA